MSAYGTRAMCHRAGQVKADEKDYHEVKAIREAQAAMEETEKRGMY